MNWREFITRAYESPLSHRHRPSFAPPATVEKARALEAALDTQLPSDLLSLLLDTDGVLDELAIAGEWIENMWLIWPVEEMLRMNMSYRSGRAGAFLERNFRELLFFAGAGADGILFAHPISPDTVASGLVLVWHPIEDSVDQAAPSLRAFVEGWLSGQIHV